MTQPNSQQIPAANMDGLVLDELEETLGYNSSDFYWLVKIIDQYHHGYIGVTAFWTWTCKTLYDTNTLHLLEGCRIFLLDKDNDLQHLNEWLERVATLADDNEGFRELCFDLQLPIGHVEWEAAETQRRIEEIRSREAEHRETRSEPTNGEGQSPRVEGSPLGAGPSQVANQTAVKNQERMAELRAILINKRLTRSSNPATHTANMAGPNKEQESTESAKFPIKQSSTSDQPANNEDAEVVQQHSKSPDAQPKQSDFTFEMAREGGPVKSPKLSKPVDMPIPSALSTAVPPITPTAMPAVMRASTRKSTATSKSSKFTMPATVKPSAHTGTGKHVKSAERANTASPGMPQRPVWKSPWKYDTIPFPSTIPQFPTSDLRNDGKSKQSMGPPSTPASAYQTNGVPHADDLDKAAESPDKFIGPLSDNEDTPTVPAVPAPDLTSLPTEEQAALVYKQLLAHGERQKAITGKYRSVADDVRAQAEAGKNVQKEGEDVDMGGH